MARKILKVLIAIPILATLILVSNPRLVFAGVGQIDGVVRQILEELGITSGGVYTPGSGGDIDDLGDVTITTPSTNQVLTYNGSIWVNQAAATPSLDINDLGDVTITTPSTNQVLTYNGSIWVNQAAAAGGWDGTSELDMSEIADPGVPGANTFRRWAEDDVLYAWATPSGTVYWSVTGDGVVEFAGSADSNTSGKLAPDVVYGHGALLTFGVSTDETVAQVTANALRITDGEGLTFGTSDDAYLFGDEATATVGLGSANGTIDGIFQAGNYESSIASITTLYNVPMDEEQVRTISLDGSSADIDGGTNIIQVDTSTLDASLAKQVVIYITESGSSELTLTFSSDWKWVVTTPTSLAADATGVLYLTSKGSGQTDIIANWVELQ